MQEIKELSEHIEEELEDAETYIKLALHYKLDKKQLADTYNVLAQEEMKHTTILHNMGVKLISEYKEKGNTPPVAMQSVYDYLHEKYIDHANRIKLYQEQYSE